MSRSKDVLNYPAWMFEALQFLDDNPGKPYTVAAEDEKDAAKVQLWWNAFRRAGLLSENHMKRFPLSRQVTTRKFRHENGRWYVDILMIDDTPEHKRWGRRVELDVKLKRY